MIGSALSVLFLFGVPVLGGIIWAHMVKMMIPHLRSLALAFIIGAIVSLAVPFVFVTALASAAGKNSMAAGLLELSSYVCGFLGLIGFLVTFVLITSEQSDE